MWPGILHMGYSKLYPISPCRDCILADVEDGLCRVLEEVADSARLRIIGILSQAKPPSSNHSASECRPIKLLQDDDNILILPADKGRAPVVMDRKDHNRRFFSCWMIPTHTKS